MSDQPEKVRINIMVDPEAAALLAELAGGPRRQGEYLSELIREAAARRRAPTLEALAGRVDDLEARVRRLETGADERPE